MPDPKDDPNSSEWRPYIFRATANIRRPCSDSSVTASQMDGVFGSDTGAAVLVRPDGYAGLTSPISSAVGHLALPRTNPPESLRSAACVLAQCARQLGLPVHHSVVPEGGNPPELLPDLAKATEGASAKARLLRVVGAGKSAVGYLLTIPEFRDILKRRRVRALKKSGPSV
jgi:hypothetical protein